jgi:hypothetical protein
MQTRGPRGPRQQRREPEPVFSRAARAPEGRRGGRRGPERREGGGPPRGGEGAPRDFDRDSRGPRRGDRDRRPGGEPRVFTIESTTPHEEPKGKKGEFTSLASLRALLQPRESKPEAPTEPPANPA